jgi:DNA-directed RNA polymerase beta' subunit
MHGNLVYYRMGLVNRYGDEYVKELERKNKHETKKYDRVELEDIITKYKIKK